MKVVYLPLDERPCNYDYPIESYRHVDGLELVYPSKSILGEKKTPGDVGALREFFTKESADADIAIISTELLLFGGLLPSRLHHYTEDDLINYFDFLAKIKKNNPKLRIYVSNLIMRTPQYDSADEEPEYYDQFGLALFNMGVLKDKALREEITSEENYQLNELIAKIPAEDVCDVENRRAFNKKVLKGNIQLVESGIVEEMVIPQDDGHPYGYTAIDQRDIYSEIKTKKLSKKILVYPGADEVGYTLLARAKNYLDRVIPKVYVFFPSINSSKIIPPFEDRPVYESLKSHLMSAGCRLAETSQEADFVLAYSILGSNSKNRKDSILLDRNRNLPYFVNEIAEFVKNGKLVGICDSAFPNGGEVALINMLSEYPDIFAKIISYRGWNTNCNSLGSVISELVAHSKLKESEKNRILARNLFDDFIYQTLIRAKVIESAPDEWEITYFDLKDKSSEISALVKQEIIKDSEQFLPSDFQKFAKDGLRISFPWNRLFEVKVDINN